MAPELVTDPEGIARTGEAFEKETTLHLGMSAPAAECGVDHCTPAQLQLPFRQQQRACL